VFRVAPPRGGTGELHHDDIVTWATRQLERKAERARELGAQVTLHVRREPPDEALIAVAAEVAATLIVVGALGRRAPGKWQLGSHADRLAQRAQVAVLVVRHADVFGAWLSRERPLRVMLGADLSRSTDAAMELVDHWRKLAPCDVTAVHLYWPPQQFERLGLDGVRSYLDPAPEVTKTLTRELMHRLASAAEPESIHVHVEAHLGRLGDRLAQLASKRDADLLVVGSHNRAARGGLWEASVSRWALHTAETSVLIVPAPADATDTAELPRLRNVLAATDLSPAGNAGIGLAYALAEPGATVHLVHVVEARSRPPLSPHDVFSLENEPEKDARRSQIHAALHALVPRQSQPRATRVYALESNDPGQAICQAALRLDADLICLGTRGRSQLAQVFLGSVSKHVLAHAERPVLLAQKPRG